MKIRAKGDSLNASVDVCGLNATIIDTLRKGGDVEVLSIPAKLYNYVEEVKASPKPKAKKEEE